MISRIAVSWSQAYCRQTLQCIFPWITVPKANSRLFQQVFCRCQQSCTWPWTSWVWSFYHTFSLQIGSVVTLGLRLPSQPSIALRSAGMFVNEISHRGFLQEDKRSLPSIKTKKVRSFFKHLMFTQLSCEGVKGWRCFCLKHDIDLLKNIYNICGCIYGVLARGKVLLLQGSGGRGLPALCKYFLLNTGMFHLEDHPSW